MARVFACGQLDPFGNFCELLEKIIERHIGRRCVFPFFVDEKLDLADVMQKLVQEKQLAGYEVPERFYEMGSPAGLAELEALLQSKKT